MDRTRGPAPGYVIVLSGQRMVSREIFPHPAAAESDCSALPDNVSAQSRTPSLCAVNRDIVNPRFPEGLTVASVQRT